MWVVAIFVLVLILTWVLGLSAFVPPPVLVILFAALGSGVSATVWFSARRRRAPESDAVAQPDTKV